MPIAMIENEKLMTLKWHIVNSKENSSEGTEEQK